MIVRAGISTHLPWARIIGEAMRAPDKLARCFADAGAVEAALHGCPAACRLGGRLRMRIPEETTIGNENGCNKAVL